MCRFLKIPYLTPPSGTIKDDTVTAMKAATHSFQRFAFSLYRQKLKLNKSVWNQSHLKVLISIFKFYIVHLNNGLLKLIKHYFFSFPSTDPSLCRVQCLGLSCLFFFQADPLQSLFSELQGHMWHIHTNTHWRGLLFGGVNEESTDEWNEWYFCPSTSFSSLPHPGVRSSPLSFIMNINMCTWTHSTHIFNKVHTHIMALSVVLRYPKQFAINLHSCMLDFTW